MKFTCSDESINSYGYRVLTDGIDLTAFTKNPIMLWNHSRSFGNKSDALPIGRWENVRKEKGVLTADAVFDTKDQYAQAIASKTEQRIISATSIGIRLVEVSEAPEHLLPGQTRPTVTKCVLREISVCDIPSNSNAVTVQLYDENDKAIDLADMSAEILPLINKKEKKMEKVLQELNLPSDAKQEDVLAAVAALKDSTAKAQAVVEKQQEEALTALISAAVKAGKIAENKREVYMSIGKSQGAAALQEVLSDLNPAIRPSQVINNSSNGGDTTQKWEDLSEKEKESLRKEDVSRYAELFAAHYGVAPDLD